MRDVTLVYLLTPESVCLAMKKRGFGSGKVNGYGGKLEEGESLTMAALRELAEESGVVASEDALEKVAEIEFSFDTKPDWNQRVHVYVARPWEGEPTESEEMQPAWYPLDSLPYDLMWVSDTHWLPRVLAGEKLKGTLGFTNDGAEVAESDFRSVESF